MFQKFQLGCVSSKLGVSVLPHFGSETSIPNDTASNRLPMASNLGVQPLSATSTGSGRSKVALKPGRSLMDWIRLTHSGKDLTSVGGKCIEVSPRELAKHNTKKDAWISLRGRVYNITHYLEYHPGGEDELMRGAGKDATDLFNEVHKWVNAESMLEKCFVGFLKKSWTFDVPKLPTMKNLKFKNKLEVAPVSSSKTSVNIPEKVCDNSVIITKNSDNEVDAARLDTKNLSLVENEGNKSVACKSDWDVSPLPKIDKHEDIIKFKEDGDNTKLIINNSNEKYFGLITHLVDKKLFLKINYSSTCIFNIELPSAIKDNYKVNTSDEKTIELTFQMLERDETNIESTSLLQKIHWMLCEPKDELVYWSCKLVSKVPVNYNTSLFKFQLPNEAKMWVPVGQHVQIKSVVEGMEVVRSYTPVVSIPNSTFVEIEENQGSTIDLLIKIYPQGVATPIIDRYNIGEHLLISNYVGSFSETLLLSCNVVTMLAAGTGITPMIKIIDWVIKAQDEKRPTLLLFFNKNEKDIIWRSELEKCSDVYKGFRVINILSEPSKDWTGVRGQINKDILNELVDAKLPDRKHQFFVCGPLPFTETAIRYLEGSGHSPDDVYAFTGS